VGKGGETVIRGKGEGLRPKKSWGEKLATRGASDTQENGYRLKWVVYVGNFD